MFEPPGDAFVAGVESFLLAAALLTLGYLLIDIAFKRYDLDNITKWGLALSGFFAYSLILMLAHLVSRGLILSNAWLIRSLTLSVAALVAIRKVRGWRSEGPQEQTKNMAPIVTVALLGVVLWCIPIFQLLPIDVTGDNNQHMGWAAQLMNGEPTPSVGLIGNVPNSYPWLYHAATVVIADFIPGGRPYHTQAAWQLLQVVGMVLALLALGRQPVGNRVCGCTVWGDDGWVWFLPR